MGVVGVHCVGMAGLGYGWWVEHAALVETRAELAGTDRQMREGLIAAGRETTRRADELAGRLKDLERGSMARLMGDVGGVAGEVGRTEKELTATRAELAQTRRDLEKVKGELATTALGLAEMRGKVERKVIEAEGFVVVDKTGRKVGVLGAEGLVVLDGKAGGRERVRAGMLAGGGYGVEVKGQRLGVVGRLWTELGGARLMVGEEKDGEASGGAGGAGFSWKVESGAARMEVQDGGGNKGLMMGADHDGSYAEFYSTDGKKCVSVNAPKDGWGVMVLDDTSNAGAMLSVVGHRPALTVFDGKGRAEWTTEGKKE